MIDAPEEDADSRFAASVKELRSARGWSQAELAERMVRRGVTDATQVIVSRIEAGKRTVRLAEAEALAAIFGRPLGTMTSPGQLSLTLDEARLALGTARRSQRDLHAAIERVILHEKEAFAAARLLADQVRATGTAADHETVTYAKKLHDELLQVALWSSEQSLVSAYTFELGASDRAWRGRDIPLDATGFMILED